MVVNLNDVVDVVVVSGVDVGNVEGFIFGNWEFV